MMFHVEHIKNCPVCGSEKQDPFLVCKDYSFSKKEFEIVACSECDFKFTNPRPDENTIGQFYHFDNYISHTNSKKGLINWLYHIVKKRALKNKLELVSKYFSKDKTLLDYGCGAGDFLALCSKRGVNVAGVEKDDNVRAIVNKKHKLNVVHPKEFSENNNTYDVITLWHVLEHLHNLNFDIEHITNRLAKNGRLVVAVPNYESYDAKFYKSKWAAYDLPRHLYHFDKQIINALFSKHGMEIEAIKPMAHDAFYVSLLSENQTNGFMPRAFIVGLLSNLFGMGKTPNHSSLIYILKRK